VRPPPALLIALCLPSAGCSGLPAASTQPIGAQQRGRVVRVVDGDTIKVRVAGRRETVRLIGIDTPESVRPATPVECGAKAAARSLRRLALTPDGRGRGVRLVLDPTQDVRDRYGRLLAYVEVAGGRDLGHAQVTEGWARVYVYGGVPFVRAGSYLAAQRDARRARAGAWKACDGDFHRKGMSFG
jgi:micrococcal nuclease